MLERLPHSGCHIEERRVGRRGRRQKSEGIPVLILERKKKGMEAALQIEKVSRSQTGVKDTSTEVLRSTSWAGIPTVEKARTVFNKYRTTAFHSIFTALRSELWYLERLESHRSCLGLANKNLSYKRGGINGTLREKGKRQYTPRKRIHRYDRRVC